MKVSVLESFARHAVRLAVVLAVLVSMAGLSHAQAAGAAAQPGTKAAAPVATPQNASPTAQSGQPAATSKRQPGGNHEGIQVHGHWTIEVRNPDGKLVSHTEFENALASNGGASLLAGLLTGTVTPGSWFVYLASDTSGDGAIVFAEPSSTAASACQANIEKQYPYQVCYDALTVTGSQLASGGTALTGNTVTFTGSAVLSSSAFAETIAWVETAQYVCSPSNSPSTCFDVAAGNEGAPSVPLTARNLGDGVDSDPPSVQVSPGQAVSVSVVISFGSGS